MATLRGNLEMVRLLLDSKADANLPDQVSMQRPGLA